MLLWTTRMLVFFAITWQLLYLGMDHCSMYCIAPSVQWTLPCHLVICFATIISAWHLSIGSIAFIFSLSCHVQGAVGLPGTRRHFNPFNCCTELILLQKFWLCYSILSIGRVNSELFSLAGGTWNQEKLTADHGSPSAVDSWMQNYVNVLCINSWQVHNSCLPLLFV